jgi:hypothetical protein
VVNFVSGLKGDVGGGPPKKTSNEGSLMLLLFGRCCCCWGGGGGKGGEGSGVIGKEVARREVGEYVIFVDGDRSGGGGDDCVEALVNASCWNLASEAVVAARCCMRSADAFAWKGGKGQYSLSEVCATMMIGNTVSGFAGE